MTAVRIPARRFSERQRVLARMAQERAERTYLGNQTETFIREERERYAALRSA